MNREECERALETLEQYMYYVYEASQETININECYEINVLRQLIDEHFELVDYIELIAPYLKGGLSDWSETDE